MFAAMHDTTTCRLCESACGLLAHVEDGVLRDLFPDPSDPVTGGAAPCAIAHRAPAALRAPSRPQRPMRRVNGALQPVSWEEAIREIGSKLRSIRAEEGADGLGLWLGEGLPRAPLAMVRALAVGVGSGTRRIFSAPMELLGPRLRAAQAVLGHPAFLLSDLGRAHFVVLIGGAGPEAGWGPGQAGGRALEELRHSRKTKGTKVVVVDAEKTPLAAEMDQHVAVRPGSEPFFILGMLSAAVKGDWRDKQFVRDYTEGWDRLAAALEAWPVERCAERCGVAPAVISGLALKFGRAAMSVMHPGWSAFQGPHGELGAWAWLCLHAITANLLRPGGLYDHRGVLDLHLPMSLVPAAEAPRLRSTDRPLLALQAPAGALPAELRLSGAGRLRALIAVEGDPVGHFGPSDQAAFDGLDLLISLSRSPSPTDDRADWVLPVLHPWERADIELFSAALLPRDLLRSAPALSRPPGEQRAVEDVLHDIFAALHPGPRGSSFGLPLTLAARALATADLAAWQRRALDLADEAAQAALGAEPFRFDRGASDRSLWRVSHPSGRLQLLPAEARAALLAAEPPAPPAALTLRMSGRAAGGPDALHRAEGPAVVRLHPKAGQAEGARVRVWTAEGGLEAAVKLDASLAEDVLDLSIFAHPAARALLPAASGEARCLDGAPVSVALA